MLSGIWGRSDDAPPVAVAHGRQEHVFAGPGGTGVPARLYPDDPVFMVKQRLEAYLGVPRATQRLFVDGAELVHPLDLLGPVRKLELRTSGDEARVDPAEAARAREVAGLLAAVREAPPGGVDVVRCRYTQWVQEVPPPPSGKRPPSLDALFKRSGTAVRGRRGALLARLVTWQGGEPRVVHLFNQDAEERLDLDALRGWKPSADAGDLLDVVVAYRPAPGAKVPGDGPDGPRKATVSVRPSGSYTVRAEFAPVDTPASEAALGALQAEVAGLARRLGLRPPDARSDVLDAVVEADLVTGSSPPPVAAVLGAVRERLYPLFAPAAGRVGARLMFKRVTGFDGLANVLAWTGEHARDPDLAAELRRVFLSLSEADARAEADRVQREGPRKPPRRLWDNIVDVHLTPSSHFFGYRLRAVRVTSLPQWRAVAQAAAHAIAREGPPSAGPRPAAAAVPDSFDLDAEAPAPRPSPREQEDDASSGPPPSEEEASQPAEDAGLVKRLYEADPRLFTLKSKKDIYARHCGRHEMRQPIVLRGKEGKEAGVAAVHYGSTPGAAATNSYACPAIWCPMSAVALPPTPHPLFDADGKRRGGVSPAASAAAEKAYKATFTCPKAALGERPLFLYESAYWGHDPMHERHVGFHATKKNADGMCLPCCFKLPKPGIVRECTGAEEDDGAEPSNSRYVIGSGVVPLAPGRYGALPGRAFRRVLPQLAEKGVAPVGRHLLRLGVPHHHPDSLMAAVAALAGFPSPSAFVDDVAARLTPATLLQLENGQLLLRLMSTVHRPVPATGRDARAWLGADGSRERGTALWNGFQALLRYLRGRDAKDPRLLYDLLLRLHGFLLAVFEVDGSGRVWFDCPSFVAYRQEPPFGLVHRVGATYEPLVVVDVKADRMTHQLTASRNDPVVRALLTRVTTTCRVAAAPPAAEGPKVRAIVLRRDLKVVGRVTAEGGVFVPYEPPLPSGHLDALLAASPGARLAHLEDLGPLPFRGGAPRLADELRRLDPASRPSAAGSVVTAHGGRWEFRVDGGGYDARTTRPVGPSFYAVPAEDERVAWTTAQQEAEAAYQAWSRGVPAKSATLAQIAARAPRAVAAAWAPRLYYERASGRDLAPPPESPAHPPGDLVVKQADIDTLRYSFVPVA